MVCLYWILKLKARFLSGDYAEALAAADKAKALLWASAVHIQLLDYFYYTALTVAALYENASADEQQGVARTPDGAPGTTARVGRKLSTDFRRQTRPGVGRDRPPRRARRSMPCVCTSRPSDRPARTASCRTRAWPTRWPRGSTRRAASRRSPTPICGTRGTAIFAGAPRERSDSSNSSIRTSASIRSQASPTATIGAPAEQLDVGAVIKASQAVSGEIVLDRLIETLMTIALEHAGAQRGLLVLMQGDTPHIEAEATTDQKSVVVTVRQEAVTPAAVPESLLNTVIRMRQSVILDDAWAQNPFSADPYIRREARSFSTLLAPGETDPTDRRALSREQPRLARVHARPNIIVGAAGVAGRDLAGKCPPLWRADR